MWFSWLAKFPGIIIIGVSASDLLPHQGWLFFLVHGVILLENGHGSLAGRRHYTKVVMDLQPPVVDCRVSQVVKGEVHYPRPLAGRGGSPFNGPDLPACIGKYFHRRKSTGMALDISSSSSQVIPSCSRKSNPPAQQSAWLSGLCLEPRSPELYSLPFLAVAAEFV